MVSYQSSSNILLPTKQPCRTPGICRRGGAPLAAGWCRLASLGHQWSSTQIFDAWRNGDSHTPIQCPPSKGLCGLNCTYVTTICFSMGSPFYRRRNRGLAPPILGIMCIKYAESILDTPFGPAPPNPVYVPTLLPSMDKLLTFNGERYILVSSMCLYLKPHFSFLKFLCCCLAQWTILQHYIAYSLYMVNSIQ